MTWNPLLDYWRFFRPWSIDASLDSGGGGFYTPRRDAPIVGGGRRTTLASIATVERYRARDRACNRWSWAVPSNKVICQLAALGPLVEVGAGTGYWARLITDAGGDIVAFDERPPTAPEMTADLEQFLKDRDRWPDGVNRFHPYASTWFDVEAADGVEAAAAHPNRTLVLCWPPYGDDFATRALTAYRNAGGRRVVYIGEGAYGCTADDEFHDLIGLGWHDDDDPCDVEPVGRITDRLTIPNWDGIRDDVYLIDLTPTS